MSMCLALQMFWCLLDLCLSIVWIYSMTAWTPAHSRHLAFIKPREKSICSSAGLMPLALWMILSCVIVQMADRRLTRSVLLVLEAVQGFRGVLKSLKLFKKVLIVISRGLKFGDGKTRIAIWLNMTIKLQKAMKHERCTFKVRSCADLCTALNGETVIVGHAQLSVFLFLSIFLLSGSLRSCLGPQLGFVPVISSGVSFAFI